MAKVRESMHKHPAQIHFELACEHWDEIDWSKLKPATGGGESISLANKKTTLTDIKENLVNICIYLKSVYLHGIKHVSRFYGAALLTSIFVDWYTAGRDVTTSWVEMCETHQDKINTIKKLLSRPENAEDLFSIFVLTMLFKSNNQTIARNFLLLKQLMEINSDKVTFAFMIVYAKRHQYSPDAAKKAMTEIEMGKRDPTFYYAYSLLTQPSILDNLQKQYGTPEAVDEFRSMLKSDKAEIEISFLWIPRVPFRFADSLSSLKPELFKQLELLFTKPYANNLHATFSLAPEVKGIVPKKYELEVIVDCKAQEREADIPAEEIRFHF